MVLPAIGGCSSWTQDELKTGATTACSEPRPQVCTYHYQPVCGRLDNGIRCVTTPCESSEWKTYGNACSACGDPGVLEYRDGECTEDPR